MSIFAELGEKLKRVYGMWSLYIDLAARFVTSLLIFFWLRGVLHAKGALFGTPVLLVMAVLVAAFGIGAVTVFMMILLTAAAFQCGLDAGAVTLAVIFILILLMLRFVPEDMALAAFFPVLMYFGFAALVPVYAGIRKKPSSVLAVIPGVVFFYLLRAVTTAEELTAGLSAEDFAERIRRFSGAVFGPELVIAAAACAACVIITFTVRTMSFDYAFYGAAAAGGAVFFALLMVGDAVLHTGFGFLLSLIGTLASCAALLLFLLIMLPLDFRRSELLRFEDDDYYYYVKAVPKISGGETEEDSEDVKQSRMLNNKED